MKNYKNIVPVLLLSMSIMLSYSCGDDDGGSGGNESTETNKGFSINTDVYETPNAYLVFSDVIQYNGETMMDELKIQNRFSFLFLDGTAIVDNGKLLYSTDTKQSTYHHFRDFDTNSSVLDVIQDVVIEEKTYTQSPNTTTRVNISGLASEVSQNGTSYGSPSFAGVNYLLTNEDVATFNIKSIVVDYETMTGTVNCEYSISPSWEGPIIGRYSGSFNILVQ